MFMLKKKSCLPLALLIVIALFTTACDQENAGRPVGCGDVKEVIVQLPPADEASDEIDKYQIELVDAASLESLQQLEAQPGESKVASIVDDGTPILIRAVAFNAAGSKIAEAESANVIGMEHDGLLCDFTLNINRHEDSAPTLEIGVDCKVIEIMQKMVKFVTTHFKQVAQVTVYVIKDTVEDMKNIIEIWTEGADQVAPQDQTADETP